MRKIHSLFIFPAAIFTLHILFPGRATSYDPCQLQTESSVPNNCTSERETKLKLICRDQFPRTVLRPWHEPHKLHILLSFYMFSEGYAPVPYGLSISNKDVPLINNWTVFWTQVFLQFKTALVNPVMFLVSTPHQNVFKVWILCQANFHSDFLMQRNLKILSDLLLHPAWDIKRATSCMHRGESQ